VTITRCFVTAMILVMSARAHATTFYSGTVSINNNTPNKNGQYPHPPGDSYFEPVSNALQVQIDKTVPTDDSGGAILGAQGSVISTASFEANRLGSFGLTAQVTTKVDRGAPIGSYNGYVSVDAKVQDMWYLDALPRYSRLRVKGVWKINGEISGDIDGNANSFPSEIDAGVTGSVDLYGTGVQPVTGGAHVTGS
jgi:hypothetical protein